ncbi:hypothetical protein HD554DRAFT_2111366, partial [Boletus coccyginus]
MFTILNPSNSECATTRSHRGLPKYYCHQEYSHRSGLQNVFPCSILDVTIIEGTAFSDKHLKDELGEGYIWMHFLLLMCAYQFIKHTIDILGFNLTRNWLFCQYNFHVIIPSIMFHALLPLCRCHGFRNRLGPANY